MLRAALLFIVSALITQVTICSDSPTIQSFSCMTSSGRNSTTSVAETIWSDADTTLAHTSKKTDLSCSSLLNARTGAEVFRLADNGLRNIWEVDEQGHGPLYCAVKHSRSSVVQALLRCGVSPDDYTQAIKRVSKLQKKLVGLKSYHDSLSKHHPQAVKLQTKLCKKIFARQQIIDMLQRYTQKV